MFKRTIWDLYIEENQQRGIITMCQALDQHLGNGIELGKITEFCGSPGSGKTQICLQLCVNVQIPKEAGGCDGNAIFIDTNQGYNPQRLNEIALALGNRINNISDLSSELPDFAFNASIILGNITYTYCEDYVQLIAIIELLTEILQNNKNVKLIAIDSISYPFRNIECYAERTQILYGILTNLHILAEKHKIAIVLTNELTTNSIDSENFYICPALGDSHSHKINQRIILDRPTSIPLEKNHHTAFIQKSINCPQAYISFEVTNKGVRDYQKLSSCNLDQTDTISINQNACIN